MDIRVTCQGSEIDSSKPYAALLNYDGEPTPNRIWRGLIAYIRDYRDDLRNKDVNSAIVLTEESATIDIADERFQLHLDINPDIPRGASVCISDSEASNYGAYGVIEEADPAYDVWVVRMLDGGAVTYSRDEIADLSHATTVAGGRVITNAETPAAFEIGEYALYTCGDPENPFSEDRIVRINTRQYSHYEPGAEWTYRATDVEIGRGTLIAGEKTLSKLPRNLQNLIINPRQG